MVKKFLMMAAVFNGQAAAGAGCVWDNIKRYNMEIR